MTTLALPRVKADFIVTGPDIEPAKFKSRREAKDWCTIKYPGSPIKEIGAQIGDWIRKRGMSTFVPGDRTCTSACALIWLAGVPRTVGDTPQIGFHAVYDPKTQRETGSGNAVVGAYLTNLGISIKAIVFMTRKGPTSVEWLTPALAREFGVAWVMLQPPRAVPIPPPLKLQPRLQPPPEVTAAWSKSARSLPEQKLPTATDPASPKLMPVVRPATTSPEPAPQQLPTGTIPASPKAFGRSRSLLGALSTTVLD
jgi:hypothetical protein